jgi:ATP-dependent Clp protease protease subunit
LIGEIAAPLSAKKIVKPQIKPSEMKEEEKVQVKASVLDKILAKLGLKSLEDFKDEAEVVAMELNTADGVVLNVEREDGEPQVGDKATPDGEFMMPDGVVIVVENGVITEIRPKEDAPVVEVMRDRIAELEKENEELKQRLAEAEANAKTTEDLRILNAVKMGGGEKALALIKSSYKPKERQPDGKNAESRANKMSADDIIAASNRGKKK